MRFRFGLIGACLVVSACDRGNPLLPTEIGTQWTYSVRTPYYTYVEPVKIVKASPVGSVKGVELNGPMGRARLGWQGSKLVAATLGGTQFEPPIPMLDAGRVDREWKGRIISKGVAKSATATLKHETETLRLASRSFKSTRAQLIVKAESSDLELISWFSAGVGIVRQEQRVDGALTLRMEWIRGPGIEN